jgi:hypothetical protein
MTPEKHISLSAGGDYGSEPFKMRLNIENGCAGGIHIS